MLTIEGAHCMADSIVNVKRNDLQPYIYIEALESTGTAISLPASSSILFSMRDYITNSLTLSRVSTGVTVTAATTGFFQYQWQSGETNTTGSFYGEFEITPASGGKFTLPVSRSLRINHIADEDAT